MRKCSICSKEKPLSEFYKTKGRWYYARCKTCHSQLTRKWHKKKKEEDPDYHRIIQRRHKTKQSAEQRTAVNKKADLYKLYRLQTEDYDRMLQEQNGLCALCRVPSSELTRKLFVDHNHTTGEIRELLCGNCNAALGMLQENPDLFRTAIKYLEKHTKKEEARA